MVCLWSLITWIVYWLLHYHAIFCSFLCHFKSCLICKMFVFIFLYRNHFIKVTNINFLSVSKKEKGFPSLKTVHLNALCTLSLLQLQRAKLCCATKFGQVLKQHVVFIGRHIELLAVCMPRMD